MPLPDKITASPPAGCTSSTDMSQISSHRAPVSAMVRTSARSRMSMKRLPVGMAEVSLANSSARR